MAEITQGLVITNLELKAGQCVDIEGVVAPDAKSFAINLGQDSSALVLHFNPRFNHLGDINTIVCNSRDENVWGAEQRESAFPFKQGDKTEVCVHFEKDQLTIKLQDGQEMQFPNRLGLETIHFLSVRYLPNVSEHRQKRKEREWKECGKESLNLKSPVYIFP